MITESAMRERAACASGFSRSSKRGYYSYLKRFLDLGAAFIASMLALPIIAIAAVVIVCDSSGSPIFRQKRIGLNGRVFYIYKLRVMYNGSEKLSHTTMDGDPRLTRVGSFLAATKLDELPQLWNVLKGDMSLIGPRPLSTTETHELLAMFSPNHPGFYPTVTPGMTGLEQISRSRKLLYHERFRLNHFYERRFNLWLDLHIFVRTLRMFPLVVYAATVAGVAEAVCLSDFCF